MSEKRDKKDEVGGKWLGRKPKGQQDTNSFRAFLDKTHKGVLQDHLARHHKGFNPRANRGAD